MITDLTILGVILVVTGYVFLFISSRKNKPEYRKAAIYCFGIALFIFVGNLIVLM